MNEKIDEESKVKRKEKKEDDKKIYRIRTSKGIRKNRSKIGFGKNGRIHESVNTCRGCRKIVSIRMWIQSI